MAVGDEHRRDLLGPAADRVERADEQVALPHIPGIDERHAVGAGVHDPVHVLGVHEVEVLAHAIDAEPPSSVIAPDVTPDHRAPLTFAAAPPRDGAVTPRLAARRQLAAAAAPITATAVVRDVEGGESAAILTA